MSATSTDPAPAPARKTKTTTNGAAATGGKASAIRLIAGLVAVSLGLAALVAIAILGMTLVRANHSSVVSIASSSFGVIGSIIGAYFGVKIGADGTKNAINGMRDESTKAQSFAAHLDPKEAEKALETYHGLQAASHVAQSASATPAHPAA